MSNTPLILLAAVLFSVSTISACTQESTPLATDEAKPVAAAAPADNGNLMLVFSEQESGIDPFQTRVLVTSQFLRMDEGDANSDFTLFDRDANVIYSVTHENKTILVIEPGSRDQITSPVALKSDIKVIEDENAPSIAGKNPIHYKLTVNDQVCKHAVVVPGLVPQAQNAFQGFRRLLASVHKENLEVTPPELQDACFLVNDVFQPLWYFEHGFPIQEWDDTGKGRQLVDYQSGAEIDPALMQLPQNYRHQKMGTPAPPLKPEAGVSG